MVNLSVIVQLLLILGFSFFAISFLGFYSATHPKKILNPRTPDSLTLEYEQVNIPTDDGIVLDAWFIPSKNKSKKTIVILHGYPASKADVLDHAAYLVDSYNIFLFDFRGLGSSTGAMTTIGYKEQDDLKAVLNYLESQEEVGEIGLLGFSMGGAVALMVDHPRVKVKVVDSSYATLNDMIVDYYRNFGPLKKVFARVTSFIAKVMFGEDISEISPLNSLSHSEVPVFFIHGLEDSQIPVSHSERLFTAKSDPKEAWFPEGVDHVQAHNVYPEEYEQKVLLFFQNYLSG